MKISVASKTEEKFTSAPSSVTVFTCDQIQAMGIKSIEQLMNFIPGFQATRESATGDGYMVASRGVTTPHASFNTLVLLDGMRLNSVLAGGAFEIEHFISIANIQKIEVIRGPGSALYGTNAITGVINIITDSNLNEVFVGAGSLKSREFYVNANTNFGENKKSKLAIFARYFGDQGESYGEEFTHLFNPSISSVSDARKGHDIYLKYAFNDRLKVNLRNMERQEDGFFNPDGFGFQQDWTKQKHRSVAASYLIKQDEIWDVKLNGYYKNTGIDYFRTVPSEASTYNTLQNFEENEIKIDFDSKYRLSDKHILFLGIDWRNSDLTLAQNKNNKNNPSGDMVFDKNAVDPGSRNVLGAHAQSKLAVFKNLEMTLGLRYDYYSDFGDKLSPRAALVYSPWESSNLKILYGSAFRAPSFRQSSSQWIGNPNLTYETVDNFEIAWFQTISKINVGVTFFNSSFSNRITVRPRNESDPIGGPRIFDNIGSLNTSGLETEVVTVFNKFYLKSAITYYFKTEETPQSISPFTFFLIANYKIKKLNFNLNSFYHDSMEKNIRSDGNVVQANTGSYFVVNSAVKYNLTTSFSVLGSADNIFNSNYYSPTRMLAFTKGLPNRGRIFSIGFEYKF